MESGLTPTHSKKPALVIIVLVLLLLGLVYVYGQNKNASKIYDKSHQVVWKTYQAQAEGFKFSYPQTWGNPVLASLPASSYRITFPHNSSSKNSVISFYMAPSGSGINKNYVEQLLKKSKVSAASTDSTSYTSLIYLPSEKISGLTMYQIVDIPKINVSAMTVTYQLTNSGPNCPAHKLSSQSGCINKTEYSDINKLAKSFQKI